MVELFLHLVSEERIICCCGFEAIREADSSTQSNQHQESNDLVSHRQHAKHAAQLSLPLFFIGPSAHVSSTCCCHGYILSFLSNQSARVRQPVCCADHIGHPWCTR